MMLDSETMVATEYKTDTVRYLKCENGKFVTKEFFQMKDHKGNELFGQVIMRGNALFLFTENGIYKRDMTLEALNKSD